MPPSNATTVRLDSYEWLPDIGPCPDLRTEYGPFEVRFGAECPMPALFLSGTPGLLGRRDRRRCEVAAEVGAGGSWQLNYVVLGPLSNRGKRRPRMRAWHRMPGWGVHGRVWPDEFPMTTSAMYRRFLAAMQELARTAFGNLPLEYPLNYVEHALAYETSGAVPFARSIIGELPPERRRAFLAHLIANGHGPTRRFAVGLLAATRGATPGTAGCTPVP